MKRLWPLARRYGFDALILAGVGIGLTGRNGGDYASTISIVAQSPFCERRLAKVRDARELHDQLSNMVFALVAPELAGKPNRAAFERGLQLLQPGLDARRQSRG